MVPKRLFFSLGAPSFEGLWALGVSDGRDTAPLGLEGGVFLWAFAFGGTEDGTLSLSFGCAVYFWVMAGPEGLCICAEGHWSRCLYNHRRTSLLKGSPMLSFIPQYGLLFEELGTLLAKGGMIAFAIDAVGSSCALVLVSMLLAATTTHSVRSSAFVLPCPNLWHLKQRIGKGT